MCYFIVVFYRSCCKPIFNFLQGTDKVTNHSGCMTMNVPIACYIIKQNAHMLKPTMPTNEHFAAFYSRKEIYVNDALACNLLYDNLLSLVLSEVENVCSNHFTWWFAESSLSHLIVSENLFTTLICLHLFNLLIKKSTVTADFSKVEMHLLSLHYFLFQNTDIATLKESARFD